MEKNRVFPKLVLKLKWDLREVFHFELTMWPFMCMSQKGQYHVMTLTFYFHFYYYLLYYPIGLILYEVRNRVTDPETS